MEIQSWLSRHYKFISAENITKLSVSSNDFLHAFLAVLNTHIDFYDIPHIFYKKNNVHPLSLNVYWVLYIYIYMVIEW